MATSTQLLIIGIGGHAVAIDPSTGSEIWRTKLKGSDFVTVSPAEQQVFAGAGGELFCLEAATGRILWHNKLKGLGTGLVTFTASGDAAAVNLMVKRRQAAAAGAVVAAT
jgi:outer membrane protein assembly factor BamB